MMDQKTAGEFLRMLEGVSYREWKMLSTRIEEEYEARRDAVTLDASGVREICRLVTLDSGGYPQAEGAQQTRMGF